MTTANIAQCPLCKGVGTVNRSMICPTCDGDGILDEKVIAAEHRGRLQVQNADPPASDKLGGLEYGGDTNSVGNGNGSGQALNWPSIRPTVA